MLDRGTLRKAGKETTISSLATCKAGDSFPVLLRPTVCPLLVKEEQEASRYFKYGGGQDFAN